MAHYLPLPHFDTPSLTLTYHLLCACDDNSYRCRMID